MYCSYRSPIFSNGPTKKLAPALHQIFRVCRGHIGGHNDTVLSGFDEGILRGEGEEKFLTPPYLPPWGSGSTKIFVHDGDLLAPCPDKILGPRI